MTANDAISNGDRILAYARRANRFDDISTIIEMTLAEARDATNADGGSFYLVTPDGALRLAYFQNATLERGGEDAARNHYVNVTFPIGDSSISGWVAMRKELLNIPDAAHIPDDAPYSFNRDLDMSSGYRTVSMLTVPVLGGGNSIMAVLQLVNALDEDGHPAPFGPEAEKYAEMLAFQSTPYLTKSIMTRRLIETMLRVSEMRDPFETGGHVQRVGAFAAEIYERWARDHGVGREEMAANKDTLRLAAMLHDIGKVAIPDAILRKPGRLSPEEYEVIKTHCAIGARVYERPESALERAAYDITLHHHQRWDGKGYTGDPNIPALSGEAIPLFARITSVADVFDALSCKRSYKEPWPLDRVFDELRDNAGTQFDPEAVAAALAIKDTLKAIIGRYE